MCIVKLYQHSYSLVFSYYELYRTHTPRVLSNRDEQRMNIPKIMTRINGTAQGKGFPCLLFHEFVFSKLW